MENIKEIRSARIVPFTLMSSVISGIVGLLYAVILVLIIGVVGTLLASTIPAALMGILTTLSVAIILVFPIGSFLLSVLSSFMMILIYNILVPRIGGIKLVMDGDEVKRLPVLPVSIMMSAIGTIMTFIAMLVIAPLLAVILEIGILSSATSAVSGLGVLSIVGIIMLIVGLPIATFVISFIATALTAILYNLFAPKIGGVKLVFGSVKDKLFEIKEIPAIPLALISAIVLTIVNFIFSLPRIATYFYGGNVAGGFGYMIGNIIGNLIITFIIYVIIAILYNFLRPKIGGVKLELE